MTEHALHQDSLLNGSPDRATVEAKLDGGQTASFKTLMKRGAQVTSHGLRRTGRFIVDFIDDLIKAREASERYSRIR